MSNFEIGPSPDDTAMYARYELASASLVAAFDWATNRPDTIEFGLWNDLDEEAQEQVIVELVGDLYTYGCAELELPTDFVDDCYSEATEE